jgi:hypothetical protein
MLVNVFNVGDNGLLFRAFKVGAVYESDEENNRFTFKTL